MVGTRRKYDSRLLLAHMARLDRIAEDERAGEDAARFDELLALAGGAAPPEELAAEGEALPLARDEAIQTARVAAVELWEDTPRRERAGGCYEAADRAAAETAACCDAWLDRARGAVDELLEAPCTAPARTVSELSTSPAEPAVAAPAGEPVTAVPPESPSPKASTPEREPRYEDFTPSPTSWRDFTEARKAFHQKMLAQRAAKG
jgi:hypothetical protein